MALQAIKMFWFDRHIVDEEGLQAKMFFYKEYIIVLSYTVCSKNPMMNMKPNCIVHIII